MSSLPDPHEKAIAYEPILNILRADLPTLFEQDISYDIYTRDIFFEDPVNQFQGKLNYRIVFWTLRFHGQLFFSDLHFDLHHVQVADALTIRADWTVRGTLRLPWQPRIFFNGYTLYALNEDGKIHEHLDTWDRSPGEILKQFWRGSDADQTP
ncbi:MAG: DUF2358 domain-containing protein [Leptolyngbyaceae cyanobacterium]